eukprot:scaffold1434_cov107-Cylindrotheca_fusiformis.AAC.4
MYPNPNLDPQQCGIAYLLEDEKYGVTDNPSLQLCDPDWVLGGVYLEEIALAMTNFMKNYSTQPVVNIGPAQRRRVEEDEDEDTQVSFEATSSDSGHEKVHQSKASNRHQSSKPFVELAVATVRKVGS